MASGHFTWGQSLFAGTEVSGVNYAQELEKFSLGVLVGLVLIALALRAVARMKAQSLDQLVVPDKKLSLFGFFDVFLEGFLSYQDSILGKENRRYASLTFSVFIFLFFSNLLGLVPGMAAITTTVWVNVGVALVVFIAFNWYGIREHGLIHYLKHFCGPAWYLAWLIFPIEIASLLLRVLTLNLRLFWNISADHVVLGTFTEMTKVVIPVIFYGLGTFVCFMQAFIFTTLTMVYILLAVQHEEGH